MLRNHCFAWSLALITLGVVSGCAQESPAPTVSREEQDAGPSAEIEKAMAELSSEDRELALAQKVCAVSGEPLGSMGKPIRVEIDGKAVFVCCDGCKKPLEANPQKYLAEDQAK